MNSEIQLGKTKNHHPNSNKTEDFPPLKIGAMELLLTHIPKRQW